MQYIFLLLLLATNSLCRAHKIFTESDIKSRGINVSSSTGIEYHVDSKISINLSYLYSYDAEKKYYFSHLYESTFYGYNADRSSIIITGIKYRF